MKKALLFIIASVCYLNTLKAHDHEVTGVIMDADNNVPIAGASIRILENGRGILTDRKGRFSINMTNYGESIKVAVSFTGYQTDTLTLCRTLDFYTIPLKQTTGKLDDVVVSTDGKTPVKENPAAIVIVSPKKIDQALQSNIMDVLVKNVPGLNAVKTGPNISKPFIRGLGYNRVLTLYDGIRQEGQQWGDEHGIEIDPYGVQKAEVIKGPASLIYGSDALAGVISMTPFMPKEQNGRIHGRLVSEYQQNSGLIGNGIRLYSSTRGWYWLASGSYRMAKNYQNRVDKRVYNTNFRETSATFSVGRHSALGTSSLNFTLFNDLQGIPDGSRDSLTRKFTKQVFEGQDDDIKKRPEVPSSALNSYRLSPLHQQIQHYRIYSNNHYRLGRGILDAFLAWQQNIRQEYSHPTAINQPGMYVRLNTFNYGVKYDLSAWSHTELAFGANGMQQYNKNKDATDFPIPDYRLWDAGVFVFNKWRYNKFSVSGGVRYDYRNMNGDPLYTLTNTNTGFDQKVKRGTPQASQLFKSFHTNFNGMSFSLGGTYAINDHISLKANIGRGYRAPNITELASNGLDPGAHIIYIGNMNSKPEFSFQQDLGMELDYPSISASVSAFNNHVSNYIYLTELSDGDNPPVDAQGNKTFQYKQAAAHLYGLEISATVRPVSWKGFSWMNSLVLTYGINTSPLYEGKGTQGRYLPYIPPGAWLSNMTQVIALRSALLPTINLMAEIDYKGPQNRYLGLYNTETATASYTLINISAGASVQYNRHQRMDLQLGINNLFNTLYQSNMSRLKYFEYFNSSPTNQYGIYAPGRNICIKIIFPFG